MCHRKQLSQFRGVLVLRDIVNSQVEMQARTRFPIENGFLVQCVRKSDFIIDVRPLVREVGN